jgi:hypothetical protein
VTVTNIVAKLGNVLSEGVEPAEDLPHVLGMRAADLGDVYLEGPGRLTNQLCHLVGVVHGLAAQNKDRFY